MKPIILFIACIAVALSGYTQTEMVSDGIVNNYAAVTSIDFCTNSMDVVNGQENQFAIGDRVLIIQMKGALADHTVSVDNGRVFDYRNAGNYETNEIKTINFAGIDGLQFEYNLERAYTVEGAVQVVKIASYANSVQFNNTLSCLPWDGSLGGVVVVEAAEDVILNANINVQGRGFRGALTYEIPNSCFNNVTGEEFEGFECEIADACGARKGEGLVAAFIPERVGRGRNANGGGGGNNDNGGAGGGSNFGAGGRGGDNDIVNTGFCEGSGGLGGDALDYGASNKIFMGGGGGAGYNGNMQATGGGNGGGLVFIISNRITANGFSINAQGDDALQAGGDGAGGGGAGGTVILDANTLTDALSIDVSGGNGGNIFDGSNCPGLGGGGGGGAVWVSGNTVPANLNTNAIGGIAGAHQTALCAGVTFGVTAGMDGGALVDFNNSIATVPFIPLNTSAGTSDTICLGESVEISASESGSFDYTFEWVNNDGNLSNLTETVAPTNGGVNIYTATVSATVHQTECIVEDPVFITVRNPNMILTFSPNVAVDAGEVVFLNAVVQPDNSNYIFSWTPAELVIPNNEKNALAEPTETTEFCLTVTDELGCTKTACEIAEVLLPFVGAPDAFTPNGDGTNDVFQVIPSNVLEQTNLTIYNRWGEIVYTSDSDFTWDGTKDGVALPQELYLWTIGVRQINTGETSQEMGEVNLIR